ncbi:MAG: putative rane protein [Patescibacteria group bacterium]|nr:putative rane protein [Patescibacteria group bacterium]
MKKYFPLFLLLIYICVFVWSAINPVDFSVWKVEAITSAISVVLLLALYLFKVRLSNLTYFLCFIFPVMHIIGAHYTFANVPFDWFNDLIGSTRNMYDRVAHASVGLYSFAIMELLLNYKTVNKKWIAYTYAIFFIMALAMTYELFEWQYAVSVNPTAGIEVLGSQGDIWDAQKDMLMDTLGAIAGFLLFIFTKRK